MTSKKITLYIVASCCLLAILGCAAYIYLGNTGRITVVKHLPDGATYRGYWKDGQPWGTGKLTTADNKVYQGTWSNGKLALAKVNFASGVYEGELANLKFNGFGILKTKNGTYYRGYWRNNKKNGLGFLKTKDNKMEFGIWKDDILSLPQGHNYTIGNKIYGIDISHHQSSINWSELCLYADNTGIVKSQDSTTQYLQPVFFVMVKSTEGDIKDPDFEKNFAMAKKLGYKRGAYHFLGYQSSIDAQIKNYIENTPLQEGDFPPILDLEIPKRIMEANCDEICKKSLIWLKAIEKHYGAKPIIYTYDSYYKDYLANKGFEGYQFWMARFYGANLPSKSDWIIWQFTDRGRVGGINRTVDIDLFRGNYQDFISYPTVKANKHIN